MLVKFLCLVLPVYSIPIAPSFKDLQTIKPDYKLIKYTFSRDNETDVMSPDPPSLQLIPLDFLCEFCQVVILKLKERQKTETNFEETIKKECLNSTDDSSSLCDVINRVNLERLKKGDPKDICESQGMCNGSTGTTTKDNGPPGVSPNQSMGTPAKPANEIERHLTIDEKSVNATLNVEDIAPYN
ncbi:Saposin B-type domain-containing protein [Caenorhabditis elegans]|uniref:Saposin B-type domain-containing protein n=1 Tax=Caenorhabditis elegans TaxID=6239 RepID=O17070_CAEEL|nr:Saposin B-type domain-containing protein [Caenorhabditis elegans]CCD62356.1 Saposin B-type domain-containing protein [Caenorhabditis elegans]|eukprot:NP_493643.2 Uncharacterized protein CELE_F23F1.7 [Caenorhabditis elegans]